MPVVAGWPVILVVVVWRGVWRERESGGGEGSKGFHHPPPPKGGERGEERGVGER